MSLVRLATIDDVPSLLAMGRRFVAETELPLTFDLENSNKTLHDMLSDDRYVIVVEEYESVLTGGLLGVVERDFCVETCAYIIKMYVDREFRGLGTARALLDTFQSEVKKRDASIVFASSTAGMGDRVEKLYIKLFERSGYKVLGRVVCKEI